VAIRPWCLEHLGTASLGCSVEASMHDSPRLTYVRAQTTKHQWQLKKHWCQHVRLMNTIAADTAHSDNGFLLQPNTPNASTFSLLSEHRFFSHTVAARRERGQSIPRVQKNRGRDVLSKEKSSGTWVVQAKAIANPLSPRLYTMRGDTWYTETPMNWHTNNQLIWKNAFSPDTCELETEMN